MSAFEGLRFNSANAAPQGRVTQAIANASARTGVDFKYLMSQAKIESSLNPNAQAQSSSARGLYQFIDQSWLAVVNEHGASYGMDWAANAIQKSANGQYYVADPALRQQILDLRNHPETASMMAAEHAADNRDYLEQQIGRRAEPVDLYLAHFLGAGGAAKFLTTMASAPNMAAASLFPSAARANASIFYDQSGNARSLAEVRASFAQRLGDANSMSGGSGTAPWAMPDGSRMVMPADYMRIAQARLGQGEANQSATGMAADPISMALGEPQDRSQTSDDGDMALYNDIQALTLGRAMTSAAPRTESARLAYLMLATLGR